MLRARANELPELVQRLGSRKRSCVDAARARLAIIGARSVDHLVEALEGDNHRIRAKVMPLLALIQDPRGRGPLIAMLLDRNSRLREIAARSLGRFPSTVSVTALVRAIEKERSLKVKVAAVQALVELYDAGQDDAVCRVLDLISDASSPSEVRRAAMTLLAKLRPSARKQILERLHVDPCETIRSAAARVEETAASPAQRPEEIEAAVAALGSIDYSVWNDAVNRLAACGTAAIEPLLSEMRGRPHDPEYCKRTGMVLKAMGRRRARAIGNALEQIDDPLPLQVLVEVVGALGDNSQIYRLKDLIDRIAGLPRHPVDGNTLEPMQRVRAQAHLELARIGSRVAIDDLREALGDAERRVEIEMLSAVEMIGKREEIGVLLLAFCREDEFVRQRIGDVVRRIRTRERIRRNHRMFQDFDRDQLRALDEILPRRGPRRAEARKSRDERIRAPSA